MAFIDGITQGAYRWIAHLIPEQYGGTDHHYVTPEDQDPADEEWEWVTTVVCGTPLRKTKCLFVPEMNDFYTDDQLNTIYHSADEYRNAMFKYGLIYKTQKFENAETPQQLLDFAKDWIKNNYHGGITSFNITALDMHLMGEQVDQYLVGQRVNVMYMDPALQEETTQTLTVISAEYDLNNPDKNSYKIGIPDVTLNKVYGETSKSGGGGGGGGKGSDETDNETNTELDQLGDDTDEAKRDWLEYALAMLFKGTKNGDEAFDFGDLLPPGVDDPTGDWVYGLSPDKLLATLVDGKIGSFGDLKIGGTPIKDFVNNLIEEYMAGQEPTGS